MEVSHALLLAAAGFAGGYIAGLAGIGGGIVFAPVLLFHFRSLDVDPTVVAPLTIGTSLLCTMVAAAASARHQLARNSVDLGIAWKVGLTSAISVVAITLFVTTRPWFNDRVFQVVFATLLCVVAARMFTGNRSAAEPVHDSRHGFARLAATGLSAGAVSATAGVGGGVVLVPAFQQALRLPMKVAAGTSSASIVIITLFATITYALHGLGVDGRTPTSVGYVDVARALLLAVPATLTAQLGVATAHRLHSNTLRRGFGVFVIVVAIRLAWTAVR